MRQALGDGNALAVIVDGDGGLMAVLDGPDDVLRSPGGVAAEENAVARTLHGLLVDHGHVPFVELDADVALDPGERIFLADGEDHVVGGEKNVSMRFRFLGLRVPFQALELHADQLAVFDDEALGRVIDDDLDAFFFGVLELPGRGFEESARAARHHLDVFSTQAATGPAAIHGGVADADDQHLFADRIGVAEGDGFQPIDADVDAIGVVTAGNVEFFAARRAGADEDRVEALVEQRFHAGDGASCSECRRPCRGSG